MMKFLQISVVVGAIVLLASCATSSMQKNVKPQQLNNKALVIGTLTYSTVNIPAKKASLTVASTDGKFSQNLSPIYKSGPGGTLSDPKTDQKGTFFSLLLAPGQYQLDNLQITSKAGQPLVSQAPMHSFTVKAGKIIYIGNINIIVNPRTKKAALLISNRRGRDLGLFKAAYSHLNWQKDLQVQLAR